MPNLNPAHGDYFLPSRARKGRNLKIHTLPQDSIKKQRRDAYQGLKNSASICFSSLADVIASAPIDLPRARDWVLKFGVGGGRWASTRDRKKKDEGIVRFVGLGSIGHLPMHWARPNISAKEMDGVER